MSQEPVLTILYNGKIVTVDKAFHMAEAVPIENGKFLMVEGHTICKAG